MNRIPSTNPTTPTGKTPAGKPHQQLIEQAARTATQITQTSPAVSNQQKTTIFINSLALGIANQQIKNKLDSQETQETRARLADERDRSHRIANRNRNQHHLGLAEASHRTASALNERFLSNQTKNLVFLHHSYGIAPWLEPLGTLPPTKIYLKNKNTQEKDQVFLETCIQRFPAVAQTLTIKEEDLPNNQSQNIAIHVVDTTTKYTLQEVAKLLRELEPEKPGKKTRSYTVAYGKLGHLPADVGGRIGTRSKCYVIDSLNTEHAHEENHENELSAIAIYEKHGSDTPNDNRRENHHTPPPVVTHSSLEAGRLLAEYARNPTPAPSEGSQNPTQNPTRDRSEAQFRAFNQNIIHVSGAPIPHPPEDHNPNKIFTAWRPTLGIVARVEGPEADQAIPHPIPHPTPLAVPKALGDSGAPEERPLRTIFPKISYVNLSHAQIESCIRARTSFEETIRPNTRQGFLLGDGTGTGKGRTISAIMAMNWLQTEQQDPHKNPSCKRAVWFSASPSLAHDARRDLTDVGFRPDMVFELPDAPVPIGAPERRALSRKSRKSRKVRKSRKSGFHTPKERITTLTHMGDGVLFTTYDALRHPTRRNAIIQWLANGENAQQAQPVVVFDECQQIQGAGSAKPSFQGQGALDLQDALPQAKVVYASSTAFHKPQTYMYAERLGLWQTERAPFEDRQHFALSVTSGGIAALELVARELRREGLSEVRLLSLDGIEQEPLIVNLSKEQEACHNIWADAWRKVHELLLLSLDAPNNNNNNNHNHFHAKHIRKTESSEGFSSIPQTKMAAVKRQFSQYLITSYKDNELIKNIEKDIAEGRAPVVQLAATHESVQDRRLREILSERGEDLTLQGENPTIPVESDLSPVQDAIEQVKENFPIYQTNIDKDGNVVLARDSQGNPLEDPRLISRRAQALALLELPQTRPWTLLDRLVHHFGDRLAEVTGRARRTIMRKTPEGLSWLEVEPRSPETCSREAEAFMNDRKQVLVFSGAGATGRSYHADLDRPNQKRRVHYLAEPGGGAHTVAQGMGRTHRTRQRSAPIVRVISSNMPGERRIMAQTVRNLNALGASTRGDRRAQSNAWFESIPDFDSGPGRRALFSILNLFDLGGHIDGQGRIMVPKLGGFQPLGDGETIRYEDIRKARIAQGASRNKARKSTTLRAPAVALDPNLHVLPKGAIDGEEWKRIAGYTYGERMSVAAFLNRVMMLKVPAQRKLMTAFEQRLNREKHWGEQHGIDTTTILRLEQPTPAVVTGKLKLPQTDEAHVLILDARNQWSYSWSSQGALTWSNLLAVAEGSDCELWYCPVRVTSDIIGNKVPHGPLALKLPQITLEEQEQNPQAPLECLIFDKKTIHRSTPVLPGDPPNVPVEGKQRTWYPLTRNTNHTQNQTYQDIFRISQGVNAYMEWNHSMYKGAQTGNHTDEYGRLAYSMPILFLTGRLMRVMPYLPHGRRIRTIIVHDQSNPKALLGTREITGIPLTPHELVQANTNMAHGAKQKRFLEAEAKAQSRYKSTMEELRGHDDPFHEADREIHEREEADIIT